MHPFEVDLNLGGESWVCRLNNNNNNKVELKLVPHERCVVGGLGVQLNWKSLHEHSWVCAFFFVIFFL